jgi:16S rRNA (guanine527-N7)-methyltransferase
VSLDDKAVARFASYRDLLVMCNARFNLTAIREPDEIERRLFLDALAMVPTLDRIRQVPHATRLVDVGAGAGVPGLALKIARPDLDVTLVDATAKKVAFLHEVIAALELPSIRAIHARAETLGQDPAFRGQFDMATARAVAALPVLLEYVVPLLRVGGTALLPKGLAIDEELGAGQRAAAALGARIVSAERLPARSTRLVIAHKVASTPVAYPRRTGVPSRAPLGEGPS